MELTGSQFKRLGDALIQAFPTTESLSQMVWFGLDHRLEEIAPPGPLIDMVFYLIEWARARGKVEQLIQAAVKDNPGNPVLRSVVDELLTPPIPILPDLTLAEQRELHHALISAFPRREYFERLVRYGLDRNLSEITLGETLNDIVFDLVQWAVAHDRVNLLIEAARSENPDNWELQAVANKLLAKFPMKGDSQVTTQQQHSQISQNPVSRDQVFISYSHEDVRWLKELQKHLKPLIRQNTIKLWDDTQIKVGENWKDEIEKALAVAKVAVLLVTPEFLASDFIADEELPRFFEAAQTEGLTIFWISVSASSYEETPIAKFQAANNPARPLNRLPTARRDAELVTICKKISQAVKAK